MENYNILNAGKFAKLLSLFRLAVMVNRTRQLTDISRPTIEIQETSTLVKFDEQHSEEQALLLADLEQEQKYLASININLSFEIGSVFQN